MSPAWIRRRKIGPSTRTPKARTSYQVLYRRLVGAGARQDPVHSAGSFTTEREAKLRRDLVAGWIAQGLDPKTELAKVSLEPQREKTLRAWAPEYQRSRIDVADETARKIPSHLKRIVGMHGDRDPATLTIADLQEWVGDLADSGLKPATVARYMVTYKLLLDYTGVDPNPARDRRVKLPRIDVAEIVPPTGRQVLAMLDKAPHRWRLSFITIEQTGMAIGETSELAWGDVDVPACRFRLRRSTVKGGIRARARVVQVPEWLMGFIADTCPLEDRAATRRVFPVLAGGVAWNTMDRACKAASIPTFSPHDLRHRRISLWHGQGIPLKQLSERAGHSKASMTLDVYSHVVPDDEIAVAAFEALLVVTR